MLECNQTRVPILFIQDVNGFDVGRDAERTGIIRRGAKLVSAVSNSRVPKITLDRRATPSAPATMHSAARRSIPGSSSPGRVPATP